MLRSMSADNDFPQIHPAVHESVQEAGSFEEQAVDALDQLWPVIMVAGSMMAVQWVVACQFGKTTASAYAFPGYLALSTAFCLNHLYHEGHIHKAWECFTDFDEQAKYMFTVVAVALSYMMSKISPGDGKSSCSIVRASSKGRGLAVEESPIVIAYPRELPKEPKASFLKMHEFLTNELLEDLANNYEAIPQQLEWMESMLRYNTVGGKLNRGMGVVDVLRAFADQEGRELRHEEVCRGSVLGWAVEWLQAFFLVADDVMDRSITRRGQPCWYKLPHVQEIAINDSFILEAHVFKMLKRYFSHDDCYVQLVELFHDVIYRTEMGQLLDLTSQPMDGAPELSRFTLGRYRMIVRYKTAYYTFYLPCAMGMIHAGVKDQSSYRLARDICCQIGEFFQIQDDYLDCFGDPATIGKVGTDIQDNKCSWLVVQALQRASEKQLAVLEDNYAKNDEVKIERVKALYRELELEKVYAEYEEQAHKDIKELIAKVDNIPHAVFDEFIGKIYKRSK